MIEEILVFRDLIQVYHWTTRNYEQHVAVGNLYDALLPLIDSFFETYQMEDRITFNKNIPLKNMNEKDFMNMIKSFSIWLSSPEFDNKVCKNRSELMNIRDEMLASVNKTIYLLSLK